MKNLGCGKEFLIPTVGGLLDGRTEPGGADFRDYRVLLNCGFNDTGKHKRLAGFKRLGLGNEDLHDQLLGGIGWVAVAEGAGVVVHGAEWSFAVDDASWAKVGMTVTVNGVALVIVEVTDISIKVRNQSGVVAVVDVGDEFWYRPDSQREAITTLFQVASDSGVRHLIACTKSRIYVNTGSAMNFRLLGDGFGGPYLSGDSPFGSPRFDVAQLGNYVVFTNNYDPVMAWKIGDGPIETGENGYKRWSLIEIYDLLGLGITAAGCVWAWNGFLFLGDVTVDGVRYGSRIYWCDFNRPLEWAPGGESLSGYVDLGGGQTVLRGATIGGSIRAYTDKAIYVGEYVATDVVFRFRDTYSGPDVMAHKWSFVNAGDSHFYLTSQSMVELRKFDAAPIRPPWLYKASGIIYNGITEDTLKNFPLDFDPLSPLDPSRCDQIAAGYNDDRQELWITWPTVGADDNDFEGVRRMSMMVSRKFGKATLVDRPCSAYSNWKTDHRMSVRDFTITYCLCDAPGSVASKEGKPLNDPVAECDSIEGYGIYSGPDYIRNATEDPELPVDQDSLCAVMGDLRLSDLCPECDQGRLFIAADLKDFALKEINETYLRRDLYVYSEDVPATFPNTSAGVYSYDGYSTLFQTELSNFQSENQKYVESVAIDFSPLSQDPHGQIRCQVGVNNTPNCGWWYDSDPLDLTCLNDDASPETNEPTGTRAGSFPTFQFYRAGTYVGLRAWIEGAPEVDGEDGSREPADCPVEITSLQFKMRQRTKTWR